MASKGEALSLSAWAEKGTMAWSQLLGRLRQEITRAQKFGRNSETLILKVNKFVEYVRTKEQKWLS